MGNNINAMVVEAGISCSQLMHLFLGKHLVLLAIVAGITFLIAAKNRTGSLDGYGISEYFGRGFFIGVSAVVSIAHFLGLTFELGTGELILSENGFINGILLLCCGAIPGLLIYIFASWIQEHKESQIRNRQYYHHLHALGRKQDIERMQRYL